MKIYFLTLNSMSKKTKKQNKSMFWLNLNFSSLSPSFSPPGRRNTNLEPLDIPEAGDN